MDVTWTRTAAESLSQLSQSNKWRHASHIILASVAYNVKELLHACTCMFLSVLLETLYVHVLAGTEIPAFSGGNHNAFQGQTIFMFHNYYSVTPTHAT